MICKGVEFSLRHVEPDLRKWQFQIGDTVTRGIRARGLWVWQPTEFKTGLTESLEGLAIWCSSKAAPGWRPLSCQARHRVA
jgi:hypothetical protein